MHGLIFATWQKFLVTNPLYGYGALNVYRKAIEGEDASIPLIDRIYDDEVLFRGVGAVQEHTKIPLDQILWHYGRFFITNDFASAHFQYLLKDIKDARGLIVRMRHGHAQMRKAYDTMMPPVFSLTPHTNGVLELGYDSPRRICKLLEGVIDGAGWRFGEQVSIDHVQCMHKGASACRLALQFLPAKGAKPMQLTPQKQQQGLAEAIYHVLPIEGGASLQQIEGSLRFQFGWGVRIKDIYALIIQLQLAGYASSHVNPYDVHQRLYKRVERIGTTSGSLLAIVR